MTDQLEGGLINPERGRLNGPAELSPADPTPRQLDLVSLALERGAGIDVVERVAALVERREAIEAKKRWAAAVAAFKEDCPPVIKRNAVYGTAKDAQGNKIRGEKGPLHYKFASYDDIKATTVPFERKHGIVTGFTFEITSSNNMTGTLKVTVGSHTEEFTFGVPIPKGVNTNTTQEFGMAQTYLKRYLYVAAFDLVIAGEDSDAVGLFEKITPEQVGQIHTITDEYEKLKIQHNHKTFLRMFGVDPDGNTGDLPPDQFETVMRQLRAKLPKDHPLKGEAK